MNGGRGPYADQTVEKEECINNDSKEHGYCTTWVESGQGKGWKHKLTNTVIHNVLYYFHVSMNRKVGTGAEEMRNEILSVLYHCTSTDQKTQHEKCVKGRESWCLYNKGLARGETPVSHAKNESVFPPDR